MNVPIVSTKAVILTKRVFDYQLHLLVYLVLWANKNLANLNHQTSPQNNKQTNFMKTLTKFKSSKLNLKKETILSFKAKLNNHKGLNIATTGPICDMLTL